MTLGALPAGLLGFAGFGEKLLDELGGLHLVELLHARSEELLGEIIGLLLVELVLVDDAQDEPTLAFSAVPPVLPAIPGRLMTIGAVAIGMAATVLMLKDLAAAAIISNRYRLLTKGKLIMLPRLLPMHVCKCV